MRAAVDIPLTCFAVFRVLAVPAGLLSMFFMNSHVIVLRRLAVVSEAYRSRAAQGPDLSSIGASLQY